MLFLLSDVVVGVKKIERSVFSNFSRNCFNESQIQREDEDVGEREDNKTKARSGYTETI